MTKNWGPEFLWFFHPITPPPTFTTPVPPRTTETTAKAQLQPLEHQPFQGVTSSQS